MTAFSQIEGHFNTSASYEVGKQGTMSFEITSSLDSISEINTLSWEFENYSFSCYNNIESYIVGGGCGSGLYVKSVSGKTNSYSLSFQVGEDAPGLIKLKLTIEGNTVKGGSFSIPYSTSLNINTISKPNINGLRSIQECCDKEVEYYASGYDRANTFIWFVDGALITSGQGSDRIKVKPNNDDSFTVKCTVGRQQADSRYTLSNSMHVNRYQVETPEIEGEKHLCLGDTMAYSLDLSKLCNVEKVKWEVTTSSSYEEVKLEPGELLKIKPKDNWLYDTVNISAQVIVKGGCIAKAAELKGIPVFEAGEVPEPDGYFEIVIKWLDDGDPCGNYRMDLEFVQQDTFRDGFIQVTPTIFHGFPHHTKDRQSIDVVVCYTNPCSAIQKCKTFEVPLPAPCSEPPYLKTEGNLTQESIQEEVKHGSMVESVQDLKEGLLVYPNPFHNYIKIRSENDMVMEVRLYNTRMEEVLRTTPRGYEEQLSLIEMTQGIYFLSIKTEKDRYFKKIISLSN